MSGNNADGCKQKAEASQNARRELVEALLKDGREELGRADGKASILLTASGVVASVLLAGAIAGDWNPTALGRFQWLWWPGSALSLAAIVSFAAAVWPRVKHDKPKSDLSFFGHVAEFKSRQELNAAIDQKVSDSLEDDRAVDQAFTVSKIVVGKYAHVRRGIALLGMGLVACGLAVALAQIHKFIAE